MSVSREGPALKCGWWRKDGRGTLRVYKLHALDANSNDGHTSEKGDCKKRIL